MRGDLEGHAGNTHLLVSTPRIYNCDKSSDFKQRQSRTPTYYMKGHMVLSLSSNCCNQSQVEQTESLSDHRRLFGKKRQKGDGRVTPQLEAVVGKREWKALGWQQCGM